ncbi:hypothetical protein KFL_014690010 [Klebsormidium nitens]|uniref:Uncharacterized protein n=1 Tax=Klebsormidium nitens TaxID=105231 RepID=A0A1Y1IVE2_KLENI|nr:hypothetical protein KFL_014690010 [Klebsormidium nitens]|eukprot:GAQ93361.1 hypothetical protein KFL_014690010 [Klebsormidium nitens]
MRRGNDGTPFGRGPRLRSFFDGFFDDPFFEDPFFQQRSAFFSSPFSSTFFSHPFGGLVDEIFQRPHPAMQSMQGTSAGDYGSSPSHQSLPALRVVELEVGEAEVASREQPLVEHPDSDAEEEDDDTGEDEGEEDDEGEGPAQAGPRWQHSPKSVRDIPIHWGDDAPAPAGTLGGHDGRCLRPWQSSEVPVAGGRRRQAGGGQQRVAARAWEARSGALVSSVVVLAPRPEGALPLRGAAAVNFLKVMDACQKKHRDRIWSYELYISAWSSRVHILTEPRDQGQTSGT